MILSGLLIALLSYTLFFLGLVGLFYKPVVLAVAFFWTTAVSIIFYFKFRFEINKHTFKRLLYDPIFYVLILQVMINVLGALGPEMSFDALWYHLTIPKIYLQIHKIVYIPGNLLYYSAMPKLAEVLFTVGLALGSDAYAKLIHFAFGLLSLIAIYKIARIKFSPRMSIISCLVFYSNLVVGWESVTAFVDLGRVFFELLALYSILNFYKTKKIKWVLSAGFMVGFAVAVKLLAFFSVFILLIIINIIAIKSLKSIRKIIYCNGIYFISFLSIVSPWLIFSYLNTGNLFFPTFSGILKEPFLNFNIINFIGYAWRLFITSSDPISPIYLITLPLIIPLLKKLKVESRIILVYSIGGIIFSYIIPYSDVARYTLPYLAGLSIIQLNILDSYKGRLTGKIVLGVIVFLSLLSVFYRAVANVKFLPVVFGVESKKHFLTHNLNFSFGDFYDVDGKIKKIVGDKEVLIYGVHNLFYVDFNYVHESWAKKGKKIKYILVQDGEIPERFLDYEIVYENPFTRVKLYANRNGVWTY